MSEASKRITEYLMVGGLFNPEIMNQTQHEAVRNTLIEAKEDIEKLERELAAVTKERDEVQANVARLLGQKDTRISDLKGRLALCQEDSARFVKELEAAEANGARLVKERDEALARIKRLEEESESRWKLAEAAIKSCAEMSSRIKRLEEAGDNLHFAFIDGYVDDICLMNWVKAKEAQP